MTRSIVLVHAVRSSSTMWRGQVKRLERAGFQVITPDLPGHGTRSAEVFTQEGALSTIGEAVSAAEEAPLLGGLSLGGYLAIHWAAQHPGRLAALVAADCTIIPGPALARAYGYWLRMKDWAPGDSDARVRQAFAKRARKRKAAKRYYGGGRAHGVVPAVVDVVGTMDLLADLAAIDVPITIVNGRQDPFRRHERQILMAAPGARLRVLDRAGHISNLDRPKRFTRVLREAAHHAGERREHQAGERHRHLASGHRGHDSSHLS